jgi:TonB family protein
MRTLHGSILGVAALACAACGSKPPENDSAPATATQQPGGDVSATRCAKPLNWSSEPDDALPPPIEPIRNVVSLGDDGRIYWNGAPVDLHVLRQYLDVTANLRTAPLFVFRVDPRASCARMREIVALASATLDCAHLCRLELGFVVPGQPGPAAPPDDDRSGAVAGPARGRANLSAYFSADDYPAAALRENLQGTTGFRLTIAPNGRVTNCAVTSSSGSAALDQATCRILRSRARYTPARDSSGNATGGTDSGRVTWRLPAD